MLALDYNKVSKVPEEKRNKQPKQTKGGQLTGQALPLPPNPRKKKKEMKKRKRKR